MRSILILLLASLLMITEINAQSEMSTKSDSPYREIPAYPEEYTPGNVAARTIDGLGYRYYWATEGLTEKDLDYRPSEDGRTTRETLDHLYGLSRTIVNATTKTPNIRPAPDQPELNFAQKRKKTLENFKQASDILKANGDKGLEEYEIVFQRGERKSEFPFWNLLNGPIADAIYHVGQVVSFRRSSGNPMNPMVNVLIGKTRE